MDWMEYTRIFIGLFAIVNPIGTVPLYLSFTENLKKQRNQIARTTATAVAVILITTMLLGSHILYFFSISLDAFRVAGGILLMLIAFGMLQARQGRTRHTPEEDEEALDSSSVSVVPLALPLLAGPGAMSTVILFSNQAEGFQSTSALIFICLLVSLLIWVILRLAPEIGKKISTTAMNITTRVMGLILAAMSVEFIAGGLRGLLPILGQSPL